MTTKAGPETSHGISIGTIAAVHGPVVDIACDHLPPLYQALSSALDRERYIFEVYQHLDERHVRAITLHSTGGLQRWLRKFGQCDKW